jgi:hypothetical protein
LHKAKVLNTSESGTLAKVTFPEIMAYNQTIKVSSVS